MIVAGTLQLQDGRKDTLINPVAIAELLSSSTQAYDRGEKFQAYRTIPGFQEYVLIDQSAMHVEQYFKTAPRQWIFSEQGGETAILKLNTVLLSSTPFRLNFRSAICTTKLPFPTPQTKRRHLEFRIVTNATATADMRK
ncbi:MAG: hypothetical protein Fur0046_34420 [Cyanobacteria bacterium J069]